jgi:TonB-linked SusC/RagA family outer membrane protein
MIRKIFLCVSILLFTSSYIEAQQTITGTVSDDSGGPLPGVAVVIKNTSNGAITDFDGNYSIEVNPGNVLVFSYIGMATQEKIFNSQRTIDVTLMPDASELSEVIVVGYGTSTRKKLTGSVSVINSESLEMMPSASFQNALQGAAPGLQVNASDGAPGAGFSIRVRGTGSINASNDPLYVVDGIPITSGSVSQTDFGNQERSSNVLASLNPNDIESLVVLKDAASTAIYGSRGANGVVMITTKSGKSGKPSVNIKSRVGISSFAYNNLLKPLNTEQYRELFYEAYENRGRSVERADNDFNSFSPINPETGTYYDTNWIDEMTQSGVTQEVDASVSGGNEKMKYYISGNYFNQDGVVINNVFKRYSTRANFSINLSNRIKFTNNFSFSKFKQRGITDGTLWEAPFYAAILLPPTIPVYDNNGRFYAEHQGIMGASNPVGSLYDNVRDLKQQRVLESFDISYEFIDGLTFKSSWNFDLLTVDEFIYLNGRYGAARNARGRGNVANTSDFNWLGTQSLNYVTHIGENHNLSLFAAYEAQEFERNIIELQAEQFAHPDLTALSIAASPTLAETRSTEYAFNSYFARLNYDYNNTYYLSGSIRRDGSSRFGAEKRWGTFWSIGGGYNISNESFLEDSDVVDLLKLRASYGITGNASIEDFESPALWSFRNRDYINNPGGSQTQASNPLLTWESQSNFNVGLDFSLFNSRIDGSVEYFERVSSDLLLDRKLSLTTGIEEITENTGDMQNTGVEVSLGLDIVKTQDVDVSVNGNITFIDNEITYLPSPIVDGSKRRAEGHDFQEYYLFQWAGVDPENGDPLWYTDETKTTTTNNRREVERFYDGKSATPDFFGGFGLNIRYKRISLGANFNYQFGNYLYNNPGWIIHSEGRFIPRSTSVYAFENRWTTPGQDAIFPRYRAGGNRTSNHRPSSRYLYEGDFIRLKTLSLRYDLPSDILERLEISSLQVYVDLDNVWTWVADKNLPFDPEQTSSGAYNTVTPITKTYSLGVSVGF